MLTLGLYVRPWIKVDYPDLPAVGRIESTYFRPETWKPDYPNPAFRNSRPEDLFWAARILAAVPVEAVRAVVRTASYSDPQATDYISETLLARRAKVLSSWLNGTNPLVDLRLDASGVLTFSNAAEAAGVGKAAENYTVSWSRFDNNSGTHEPVGSEETVFAPRVQAPEALLAGAPEFVCVRVRAFNADHPAWSQPLIAYFRRAANEWSLVGLDRNP
jgi:hypothetical protein